MTICISIKVPDGLVLAADSMSVHTVFNPNTQDWDVVQSYSYANKVIQIGDAPIGALVWGQGSLQRRSIQNLIEEFSLGHPGGTNTTVQQTAKDLSAFMWKVYEVEYPDPSKRPYLGCLVGGYDKTGPFAKQWAYEFPGTLAPVELLPDSGGLPAFSAQWFGQTDALARLLHGFDYRLIQALKDKGLDPALVDDCFSVTNLFDKKIPYEIIYNGMPLQDAIDFAAYLVHVVKGRFRFIAGPKVCGGPVDIAVVKPFTFEWIKRKTLSHNHDV